MGIRVSHDGIPVQPHVGGSVFALQNQSLQSPLLAERVIRGISEKVVHTFLPDARLHSIDDGSHASVKFARHIDRKRFLFHHGSRSATAHNILSRRGFAAAVSGTTMLPVDSRYAGASNSAQALATADA